MSNCYHKIHGEAVCLRCDMHLDMDDIKNLIVDNEKLKADKAKLEKKVSKLEEKIYHVTCVNDIVRPRL